LPAELVTLVENATWPASASLIEIEPDAVRLPLPLTPASSVTTATVGVPMTAVSLTPLMVKLTTLVVPSMLVTVKVSTWALPAPSDWVAAFDTV
jgi:hypothetical protein